MFFKGYSGHSSSEDDSVVHVILPSAESSLSDTVVSWLLSQHFSQSQVNWSISIQSNLSYVCFYRCEMAEMKWALQQWRTFCIGKIQHGQHDILFPKQHNVSTVQQLIFFSLGYLQTFQTHTTSIWSSKKILSLQCWMYEHEIMKCL